MTTRFCFSENVLADGILGNGYDLEADDDLLAITCRGLDTAFVAGEGGTLLRTFDGGETWESIDLGTTRTLRENALHVRDRDVSLENHAIDDRCMTR